MAGSQAFQEELEKAQGGSMPSTRNTSSFSLPREQEDIDTPVSDATMSGAYAPDNSVEASQKRLDAYSASNAKNQDKYIGRGFDVASTAVKQADKYAYTDPAELDKRVSARPQYHRDQATIKGSEIFGDIFGLEGPSWNSAEPGEPVETPDFSKMYKDYTKF